MAYSHKTLRGRRYWDLRVNAHMAPAEAREFSKLTRKYPALKAIVAQRTAQWDKFVKEAVRKGWESENRRAYEWKKKIVNFYSQERKKQRRDRATGKVGGTFTWVVTKNVHGEPTRPKISPWEWYDAVFQRLPPEMKWDTPRTGRTVQPDVQISKVQKQRWIADLQKAIRATGSEKKKAQFREQIENLKRGGG